MNLQEKMDESVEQYQQNEQEITKLEDAIQEREKLRQQLIGKISTLEELIDHETKIDDGDTDIIEGKAEEVREDG